MNSIFSLLFVSTFLKMGYFLKRAEVIKKITAPFLIYWCYSLSIEWVLWLCEGTNLCFFLFFLRLDAEILKRAKKIISTSEWHSNLPMAGWNTQLRLFNLWRHYASNFEELQSIQFLWDLPHDFWKYIHRAHYLYWSDISFLCCL